jgi:hypothetical protein
VAVGPDIGFRWGLSNLKVIVGIAFARDRLSLACWPPALAVNLQAGRPSRTALRGQFSRTFSGHRRETPGHPQRRHRLNWPSRAHPCAADLPQELASAAGDPERIRFAHHAISSSLEFSTPSPENSRRIQAPSSGADPTCGFAFVGKMARPGRSSQNTRAPYHDIAMLSTYVLNTTQALHLLLTSCCVTQCASNNNMGQVAVE